MTNQPVLGFDAEEFLVAYWHDWASYLLTAEAQRKDYVVELVSEDVFTYNDQLDDGSKGEYR